MIHVGIHVGIKAVLAGGIDIPGGGRHTFDETDFDDGLDALETVFPGNDEAHGSAVLIGKRLAVHADAEKRQRVHGFIETQPFDVGKFDAGVGGQRHLARIIVGLESDELGFFGGLGEFQDVAERIADPGNHDGPAFHAAMAINALFEWSELQNVVHAVLGGLFHFTFDGDGPRGSAEFAGVAGGSPLSVPNS